MCFDSRNHGLPVFVASGDLAQRLREAAEDLTVAARVIDQMMAQIREQSETIGRVRAELAEMLRQENNRQ